MSIPELGIIDDSVKLPRMVLAGIALSEDTHKQAYNTEPAKEPPKEGEVTPEPPKEPVTPAGNTLPVDEQSWEHRYKSMEGRYKAEVPRLREQIRSMNDQIASLQSTMAAMEAAPKPVETPKELKAQSLITADELKDYGEEFLSVVGKKAKEELVPLVASLQEEIKGLKSQLGNVGTSLAVNARDKMFGSLDKELSDWREINQKQEFLDWLDLPDAYSGDTRMNLLRRAFERNDAPRVLAFFQGFLSEEAALDPARVSKPNGADNSGKVPLENLVAPGRARTAAGKDSTPEKPILTTRDIANFYSLVQQGKYRGRDKERAEHEAMIFEAQKDGRIR
jgi:prefoldin subunit 5